MFKKSLILLLIILVIGLGSGCISNKTIEGQFDVNNDYSVYRDSVHVSHGWLFVEGYQSKDFDADHLVEHEYDDIAIQGKDEVNKNEKDELYYKNPSFLSFFAPPFTGVYLEIREKDLSLNAKRTSMDDIYYITKALLFEEGILKESKEFINEELTEEILYYSGKDEDVWMHIVSDTSSGKKVSTAKDYYSNGNLRALIKTAGSNLETYEEYYENAQLKREVLPLKGKLEASISYIRNVPKRSVEIEQGKSVHYDEDGELIGEYEYINGERAIIE